MEASSGNLSATLLVGAGFCINLKEVARSFAFWSLDGEEEVGFLTVP